MAEAFVNARVLGVDGFRDDVAVLVDDGRIEAILAADDARLRDANRHDLGGRRLVPGFVDCQVNGGGDVLFNDAPTVATIRRIADAHRRFGTTGFLPTLISDDVEVMRAAIAAVDAAIRAGVPGVLGIHLEGPYLAKTRRGVHDAAKFRVPDAAEIDLVASLAGGVTLLTLAPECVPPAAIRKLTERGVIVAAGHTAATYATTRAALYAGVRGFTHLYNAMSPLASREPGVVGAALEDAASWCGIVADGHHVHPASLRVALAAKPRGKLFLVTDAMPPVGGAAETFALGGVEIACRDGRCETPEGVLAGSALDMASAVRNATGSLGIALDEAVRMASAYPADFLGIANAVGRIAPGLRADFVVLDDALGVHDVFIAGTRALDR
jgi:N-acetylglucosamine-6-phosphate deacetylase